MAGDSYLSCKDEETGYKGMKESTKKVATALLLYHEQQKRGNQMPTGDSIYVLSQQMMHALASSPEPTPMGVPALAVYPTHPSALSKEHLQASYGDGKPLVNDFPGLAQLVRYNTPVRCSNKMVTATNACKKKEPDQQVVSPTSDTSMATMMNMLCKTFNQNMMNKSQGQPDAKVTFLKGSQTGTQPCAPDLALHASRKPGQTLPIADKQRDCDPKAEAEAEQPECQQQGGGKSLEGFEQEAFNKLSGGKRTKQPSGGCKAFKRPAASKKHAAPKANAASSTSTSKTMKLGCRKCRGSHNGCQQCRNPSYQGRRLCRSEWNKLSTKLGLT